MKYALRTILLVSATLLVSACSESDMNHFLASGQGDWSAFGASSSGSSSPSVRTYAPRRCYQTSRTHQTCYN